MSTTRNSLSALYRRLRESVLQRTGSRPKAKHLLLLPPVSGAMQTSFNPPATVEKGNLGRTVLVHGYKDDATVFEPLVKYLSELGLPTYTVTLAPSDASVPLETLAIQLHAYIESNFAANQPLDFVGFSMGGMVVRYYLQRMGGLARTRRFLSVAAPHHGTWTAFTSRLPTAIQLRPNSLFLQDLNADVERLAAIQFASMWTPLDMMIVPSFSSVLPFGENLLVWTLMHKSLITSRRGISAIAQHLLDGYGRVPSPPSTTGRRAACHRGRHNRREWGGERKERTAIFAYGRVLSLLTPHSSKFLHQTLHLCRVPAAAGHLNAAAQVDTIGA